MNMVKSMPIPCTREEMNALLEASMSNDFFYMFFSVAKKTGRRLGEYWEVKVKDVDFEKKTMMTRVLKRKIRIEKEAILDDNLIYLIKRYIAKEKLKLDDYLFRKVGYRQVQNRVKSFSKKAGINHNVSFHNFRHYFVTELLKKNWSYDKISKLTGHSSVGTLAHYDHMVAADIADEARETISSI